MKLYDVAIRLRSVDHNLDWSSNFTQSARFTESERCITSPSTIKLRRTLQTHQIFLSLVPFMQMLLSAACTRQVTAVVLWRHPARRSSPRTHKWLTDSCNRRQTQQHKARPRVQAEHGPSVSTYLLNVTYFQSHHMKAMRLHQLLKSCGSHSSALTHTHTPDFLRADSSFLALRHGKKRVNSKQPCRQ